MVLRGSVSYLCDATQNLVISNAWAQQLAAYYSPDKIVRVSCRANNINAIPTGLYRKGANRYQALGVSVGGVLELGFNQPWLEAKPRKIYPNEKLGYDGNKRHNRWIKDTCVRAGVFAESMVKAGMDTFWIGNEFNLLGSIKPGANVPPVASDKAPAMAPEVAFSFLYEMAGYLRAAGAKHIFTGSMSFLPQGGVDDANPYGAGYITKGMDYLVSTGVKQFTANNRLNGPPLWDGIGLNMEGWWDSKGAQAATHAVNKAFAKYNVFLPIIVGEWGQKNPAVAVPGGAGKALDTFAALVSAVAPNGRLYFFSHNLAKPNDATDYGAEFWAVANGEFGPTGEQAPWAAVARSLLNPPLDLPSDKSMDIHVPGS